MLYKRYKNTIGYCHCPALGNVNSSVLNIQKIAFGYINSNVYNSLYEMSNVVHTNIIRKYQESSIGYGKDKSHFKYIISEDIAPYTIIRIHEGIVHLSCMTKISGNMNYHRHVINKTWYRKFENFTSV